jgi:DNA-directed RNA polymerase subunit beta
VTTLLRAISFSGDNEIINIFGLADEIEATEENLKKNEGRKLAAKVLKTWTEDFVDEETGEVIPVERTMPIVERGETLDETVMQELAENGVKTILLQKEEEKDKEFAIIHNTLAKDPTNTETEAINYIYKQLRNSEPPDEATARDVIDKLFFSEKRYDLGDVGRYRLNKKLDLTVADDVRVLTKTDIIEIIKYLVQLINSKAIVDDIDHLSNRRIRTVGEQLAN